ncbi:MAG: D-alanine--D-alanine ligase [Pseudomonadota bacterium]
MTEIKKVAVLMGGQSSEREVSLSSGAGCAKALRSAGYDVVEIDVAADVAARLKAAAPDVAFNALHGKGGEDGCIQGLLETLRIPYTHSGVLASALAMDKNLAKDVLAAAGVPVPEGRIVTLEDAAAAHVLEPPYVVKPNDGGSSVGVHIIRKGENRPPAALAAPGAGLADAVLVEKFIPGRELTVSVLGDRALSVTEIVPRTAFYDYEAKYAEGGSSHILPADIPEEIAAECRRLALLSHATLKCRGLTRTDFRYDDSQAGKKGLYVLELNTQPGMTPTSLSPEQAAHEGMAYEDLTRWIVEDASCDR